MLRRYREKFWPAEKVHQARQSYARKRLEERTADLAAQEKGTCERARAAAHGKQADAEQKKE